MKLSLELFNKLVSEVTIARQIQKERNEEKALMEELKQEDIEKLQRVLQPVLEETVASPIHKLHEGVMKNLKQIEGRQKQLEARVIVTLQGYIPFSTLMSVVGISMFMKHK